MPRGRERWEQRMLLGAPSYFLLHPGLRELDLRLGCARAESWRMVGKVWVLVGT